MKPLQTDLSIYQKFNFEKPPVGVKYLFHKPEGIEPLVKSLALCEMLKEAHQREAPFYSFILYSENSSVQSVAHVHSSAIASYISKDIIQV
jgi:hypothetical protein